jgi:hypothetical protein
MEASMNRATSVPVRLRSAALVGATIVLGISWSFSLLHVRTQVYPLLWATAMPLLAFYYVNRSPRGTWKHLPAAALSVYALVLWRISGGYGLFGGISLGLGVATSLAVFWLSARWNDSQPHAAAALPATNSPAKRRRTGRGRRRPA